MPSYFCTAIDVAARMSSAGVGRRLDDDPNAFTLVAQEVTNKIRLYTSTIYKETDLYANATNGGWVNDAAITLACCALCRRRGNPIPEEFKQDCKALLEELMAINKGQLQIPGYEGDPMAQRHTAMPTFSNLCVRPYYYVHKIRVERQISELSTPTGYPQKVDWFTDYIVEY